MLIKKAKQSKLIIFTKTVLVLDIVVFGFSYLCYRSLNNSIGKGICGLRIQWERFRSSILAVEGKSYALMTLPETPLTRFLRIAVPLTFVGALISLRKDPDSYNPYEEAMRRYNIVFRNPEKFKNSEDKESG